MSDIENAISEDVENQVTTDAPEPVADPGWRRCEACQIPKKLEAKNFYRAKTSDEFDYICKTCKKAIQRKRKLDKLEANACDAFISKANNGGSDIPHTSELLESIMSLMGGSNGFAAALLHQYNSAPAGGRIRTQILQLVSKLTEKVAESGATRAPASLLSDEELEAAIEKRMETAVLSFKGQKVLSAKVLDEVPDCGRSVDVSDARTA